MNCPEWSIRSTRLKRSTSSCARLDALCDRLHVDAVAHLDCRGDYGALDDLGDGQAVVIHAADAATQAHGELSPVAVPLHVEKTREAALLHELAPRQESEPVGLETRRDDRLHRAVLQGIEHDGEGFVAALDAERVVDCLEVEYVEHNHGVGAAVAFGEHPLDLSDEALTRVAAGDGVVVLLLEQLVQLVVGARAKDVVGNRARRTGLVETHKAPVAFLANLELGAQPRYRVVEADDGVVFVDDVSARRSIAHEPCLRSAAHCLS